MPASDAPQASSHSCRSASHGQLPGPGNPILNPYPWRLLTVPFLAFLSSVAKTPLALMGPTRVSTSGLQASSPRHNRRRILDRSFRHHASMGTVRSLPS